MKPNALTLAIAAAAFSASTLYLAVQLNHERTQSDKLIAETRALNARIAALEKTRGAQGLAAANPFSPRTSASVLGSGHPVPVEGGTGVDHAFMESVAVNVPPPNPELLNKIMRSQVRAHNKRIYAEIAQHLGIGKDEANKLISLLTEQQLQSSTSWHDAASAENALRQMVEKDRADKAQIAELLGADKAQLFEEYRQSLPARQELDMLARQLDGADAPLSEEQQKRLLEIFAEERKRVPAPTLADAASPEEYWKALATWQSNYEENVTAQTRTVLNAEQLSTFNEYQDWQTQLRPGMGAAHAGRFQSIPGVPNVMFATSAPAVHVDLAVASPAAENGVATSPADK
jgi:hypothetical protein